ncbi:cache domain-containing protein [Desulfosporosinus sp. PR]|uniref:cache domain-containing protein n=1 Tax=Candidatus Desulfosporosinus nitrosoreducens TaxID=3401928 RepID=UPI0027F38F49|nr:cache domain-containing protein [Desulfosporosinus sp. PR]MDQ7095117.1 cache domain-containing protein [Desulfosporosinus sp. PR]
MRSLKQQILILLLGSLIVLAVCFIVAFGWFMKNRAEDAAFIKAQADLATCEEIMDKTFPGPWHEQNGELYKGPAKISLNNQFVDHLSLLTGDTVTIFLGDTRVATTVRGSSEERAIGTKVSANVAQTVLQNGQTFVGKANVVGQWYETGYVPLRTESGNIIGMFYVGISHDYDQKTINGSLITLGILGLSLTIIVALITWFFLQKFIIHPLHNITLGARDIATGHLTQKIKISGSKEIKELENAFNQMVEQLQSLTSEINKTTCDFENNLVPSEEAIYSPPPPDAIVSNPTLDDTTTVNAAEPPTANAVNTGHFRGQSLPKGLNQATLEHVLKFVQTIERPISAEEVAEGVQLTRVTVRRYLEFLEQCGVLKSDQKYGTVGRPLKLFIPL